MGFIKKIPIKYLHRLLLAGGVLAAFLLVQAVALPFISLMATSLNTAGTLSRPADSSTWMDAPPVSSSAIPRRDTGESPETAANSAYRNQLVNRLNKLLGTTTSWSSCPAVMLLGGMCNRCRVKFEDKYTERIFPQLDGNKLVCVDMLSPNCTVLSFGINNDFSFDEAMEDLGCTVHAFDPTMGSSGFRHSAGIEFHGVGLGPEDDYLRQTPLLSLRTILQRLGWQEGVIDYVKLDIESSEWGVLKQQLDSGGDLLRVRQLQVEFHLLQWEPLLYEGQRGMPGHRLRKLEAGELKKYIGVVESLHKAGFRLVHKKDYLCQFYEGECFHYMWENLYVNERFD